MSFLPTYFLSFFGDEREREREREIEESVSLLEGERGGVQRRRRRSSRKLWKGMAWT